MSLLIGAVIGSILGYLILIGIFWLAEAIIEKAKGGDKNEGKD